VSRRAIKLAKPTERGFLRSDFKDASGAACSIQESSLATDYCIWLGQGDGRMHLTRKLARELIEWLGAFADTGTLAPMRGRGQWKPPEP